jgi:hypothetical protein
MLDSFRMALIAFAAFVGMTKAADETLPKFKVTSKRDTDRVEIKVEKETTVFSITSPVGISEATIERTDEKWSNDVVLRLHLKGLENFKVTNGKVKLEGSASFQDGKPVVRLWKDGKEDAPLDAKSQHWMDVRIFDADGKQAKNIPLKGGYFEMQLPKALFEGDSKSITVNWFDFYRN